MTGESASTFDDLGQIHRVYEQTLMPSVPLDAMRNQHYSSEKPFIRDTSKNLALPFSYLSRFHCSTMNMPCPFETTFVNKERRFPFFDADKLFLVSSELAHIRNTDAIAEHELNKELIEIQRQLLPNDDYAKRKEQFLYKLGCLLKREWPEKQFKVHAFGSTENMLGTRYSDVDVCIETDWIGFEHRTCQLSAFMHRCGMQRVECRSQAKVPLVSFHDVEFDISCDININNTIALRNTRMVRTYIQIDIRAQLLTMMIKHWTKARGINDAVCNTLTSYSWTLLVINFLQTRDPPVLPCLHTWPHEKLPPIRGTDVSFADDVSKYDLANYGKRNSDSVGALLLGFFHYYTYVVDYARDVVSVRLGRPIPKYMKQYPSDNVIAIEEPFTTTRNLGNTADMGSFHGIHEELQRAHRLLAQGKSFKVVCEIYETRGDRSLIPKVPTTRRDALLSRVRTSKAPRITRSLTRSETKPAAESGLYQPPALSHSTQAARATESSFHLSAYCAAEHLQYLNSMTSTEYASTHLPSRSNTIHNVDWFPHKPNAARSRSTPQSTRHGSMNHNEVQTRRPRANALHIGDRSLQLNGYPWSLPHLQDMIVKPYTANINTTYADACRAIGRFSSHDDHTFADNYQGQQALFPTSIQFPDSSGSDAEETQSSYSQSRSSSSCSPQSSLGSCSPESCISALDIGLGGMHIEKSNLAHNRLSLQTMAVNTHPPKPSKPVPTFEPISIRESYASKAKNIATDNS